MALYVNLRNGRAPGGATRQLVAKVAAAVPSAAVQLPNLLDAIDPQARAAVRAQARREAASKVEPGRGQVGKLGSTASLGGGPQSGRVRAGH